MSSALIAYPQLPPTTNFLNSQQRFRLMRSTRKLGAVLGTTPYLLENDTSFALLPLGKTTSKALKRQGSIFTHHQSSSLSVSSSSASTTSSHHRSPSTSSINLPRSATQSTESLPLSPPGLAPRKGNKPPQLYLRLNPISVSPTGDRITSSLPPTPSTPSPPTPISPAVPDVTEIRRKRMAKLVRQLGENVPAELVFPPEAAPKTTLVPPQCRARRRSRSVHFAPTEIKCLSDDRPFGVMQDWVGEWNRSNIKDVQKELRNLRVK